MSIVSGERFYYNKSLLGDGKDLNDIRWVTDFKHGVRKDAVTRLFPQDETLRDHFVHRKNPHKSYFLDFDMLDLEPWLHYWDENSDRPPHRKFGDLAVILYDFCFIKPRVFILPFRVDNTHLEDSIYLYRIDAEVEPEDPFTVEKRIYGISMAFEYCDNDDASEFHGPTKREITCASFLYDAGAGSFTLASGGTPVGTLEKS